MTSAKSSFVLILLLAVAAALWVQKIELFASSNNEEEEEQQQEEEEDSTTTTTTEDTQNTAAEFVPETCFTLTIPECNEVNERAKTEQTFLPRCSIILADGQQITIYKESTKTCSTSQEELGGYTYQRYQEEAMQEFNNEMNEARESW